MRSSLSLIMSQSLRLRRRDWFSSLRRISITSKSDTKSLKEKEARCSSVVRAFAHGAMGRWINPSWGEPIELFLVPASAPRLA